MPMRPVLPLDTGYLWSLWGHHVLLVVASGLKKSVKFNEEVQVEQFDPDSVRIEESVIDQALDQIQNADPTGMTEDSPEMIHLEGKHIHNVCIEPAGFTMSAF